MNNRLETKWMTSGTSSMTRTLCAPVMECILRNEVISDSLERALGMPGRIYKERRLEEDLQGRMYARKVKGSLTG